MRVEVSYYTTLIVILVVVSKLPEKRKNGRNAFTAISNGITTEKTDNPLEKTGRLEAAIRAPPTLN